MVKNERNTEYRGTIGVDPKDQRWGFAGFVKKDNKLFLDIVYTLMGRNQGLILRTAVDDSYVYDGIGFVPGVNEYYDPKYHSKIIPYDTSLFDYKKVHLGFKRLNLEQVSVFAGLVNEMVKEKGLENITQEDIFGNEDVRSILGLDEESPFAYTPVKKNSRNKTPELS